MQPSAFDGLVFASTSGYGNGTIATIYALDAETGASFMSIDVVQPGALGPDDADEVSEDLPLNSAAMLIAFENRWAEEIVSTLRDADAFVIDTVRIPADVVESVITA